LGQGVAPPGEQRIGRFHPLHTPPGPGRFRAPSSP
jgi:hypothetical protein